MRTTLMVLGVVLGMAAGAQAQLRYVGDIVGATISGSRVDLAIANGAVARIDAIADDTLRVRFAPSGALTSRSSGAVILRSTTAPLVSIFDTGEAIYIVGRAFTVSIQKHPYRLVVWRASGTLVQADLSPAVAWDPHSGVVLTRKWAPPDERYYGMGERGGPLNRRGRQFAMRNQDRAAYGPLTDPLYISIPYFWGARGSDAYGVFLDNPAVPFFDFDPNNEGALAFGALAGELDYYLFTGPSPSNVTAAYGRITGFSGLPPKWTLGYHQSRYGYASQTELLTIARTLRAQRVPADVLYLDIDYLDRLQMFSWNLDAFPNPFEMNALLGQLGFRRVNIMEPVIHTGDRFWSALAQAGYFVKNQFGDALVNPIWYGTVSWLDFTKTEAARWYKDALKGFLITGIDAVWNDLNEPAANEMPDASFDFDGSPRGDLEARNVYALREGAASYDAQRELRPGVRPWGISRAGYAGIQRYIANWGGDALSDWDTLRTNIQMSLSMGLSGQNFFGHDIGGFLGAPSPELFTRWTEFAAYTPLFRNHAMNTSPAREPWAFGEPTLSTVREIINERYRLLPYIYTLFERASRTGEPMLAPAFFEFPGDPATWNDDTAFMVGPSLLVAPVFAEGATSRPVYLPEGSDWFDSRSDERLAGGTISEVPAPLGAPPVFVRAPAIVPKGPVMQYTGERPLTDVRVHLYPAHASFDTSFTLYEDDGISFAYEAGDYLRTRITFRGTAAGEECVIERAAGAFAPPAGRVWTLELHGADVIAEVRINDVTVPKVASEADLVAAGSGWTAVGTRILVRVPDLANVIRAEMINVPSHP
jgi:alpha-glucosidase